MFYEAIYQPVEMKKLNSKTQRFVGKTIALQYGGRIPVDTHKGKHCYIPYPRFSTWIAESDLKNLSNISLGRWKEVQMEFKKTTK
jgi:hypothetical protein